MYLYIMKNGHLEQSKDIPQWAEIATNLKNLTVVQFNQERQRFQFLGDDGTWQEINSR